MADLSGEVRTGFQSIGEGGLKLTGLPMRLFSKGHRLFWDPSAIDLSQDAKDWAELTDDEREMALRLATLFLAGEEAVAKDIQPFMHAMSEEGRLEDEIYLTQFAFEEAKHVEAWRRWLDAVGATNDLSSFVDENPHYRTVFYDLLPHSLRALQDDPSPAAQVKAATVYHQVVEGVLAMTGYHSWRRSAEDRNILPGVQEIVRLIGRDERRHMAWGTYTCRRHIAADPANWDVFQNTLNELMEPAIAMIEYTYQVWEERGREIPFDIPRDELTQYATRQFTSRFNVIEAAKGSLVEDVEGAEEEDLEDRLESEDLNRISA